MKRIKEKDGRRGLVPARENGIRDEAFGSYLEALDPAGNQDVRMALLLSEDPRFREFISRVGTPRYKTVSLQAIAKACGIDLLEFNEFWQKASVQRAIALAQLRSVQIAGDMAEDARSRDEVCPRCDDLGWVNAPDNLVGEPPRGYRVMGTQTRKGQDPETGKVVEEEVVIWGRDCPVCLGKGRLSQPGDQHSRDKILEMSGLITKGGGKGVQIVQNFSGSGHSSAVPALSSMTFEVSPVED